MSAAARRPNIILINADDLGYGDLGCYGSTRNATPHLDRLAAEGVRCTDFYQASPVCTPSRGAMMTGCYPPRIGFAEFSTHTPNATVKNPNKQWVLFPGMPCGLNPKEKTIARLLKDSGYATACVGKWHCGDQKAFLPTAHGFDHYFGLPYSNDMGRQVRPNGGISPWPPLPLLRGDQVVQQQPEQDALTERYVDESLSFIRAHKDAAFFLYLAHFHVHIPHYVSARFMKESQNGPYGAAVAAIDWSVGVIMAELKALGLDDNTLIMFTSDNGSRARDEGGSNGALRGHKGQTWDGGQRLPLIARWPSQLPAGTVVNQVCASIDLLPTLAGIGGTTAPTDRIIDGRDILPVLRGTTLTEKPFFYFMRHNLEAVRFGRWKLHVSRDGKIIEELYNLHDDIGETTNVATTNGAVVTELQALVTTCRTDLGDQVTGVTGANCRPVGMVDNPVPLTTYDEHYPYIRALYDLPHAG